MIRHFISKLNRFLWSLGNSFEKRILEDDSEFMKKLVNYETFKKSFVQRYMRDNGFGVPAITRVVLKNGFESIVAVSFFAEEHMILDVENGKAEVVYTDDLLKTDYYIGEES